MVAPVTKILEEALGLPEDDRMKLASELLASLEGEAEPPTEAEAAWAKEIDRRVDEYVRGDVKGIDAADVIAEARTRLRTRG